MSIKDLLEKVNKVQNVNQTTPMEQEVVKETYPKNQDANIAELSNTIDLSKLSSKDLLEINTQLMSWLETHECQAGTNNKLDINDRPYNPELYLKKLRLYEEIYAEYFSRPLGEELEGVL